LANYTDADPQLNKGITAKKKKLFLKCMWPYVYMLIKYNGDVIPCCNHRLGNQYTNQESVVIGNAFKSSVKEIWRSNNYSQLRKLIADPSRINSEEEMKKTFCYGCPKLFIGESKSDRLSARDHDYEEFYSLNKKGIPIRKTETL
jgi:MoaA/NifB/PqqE/SkfB family radical SAM enzyme